MNILVFSWRDPKHSFAGGAEQVMHEHMKAWVEAGHKVTLFASRIKGYAKSKEVLDGVKIIRKGYQILGVQILAFFWYLFGKHEEFDLIVDQFHGIPFFTPLYIHKPKLAVLQEVAREVWFKNHLSKPFNWIIGLIGYLVEPLVFLFYRKVRFMVGSNSAKEDLKKFGIPDGNITIVPHGVILPKHQTSYLKSRTKTILFLGALAKDKGIEDALDVFARLNRVGKYRFWVIGRGGVSYLRELELRCQRLGIEDKVKFWGYVSQEKKFELLARSHLLVNPSIREGWGLVNIEANAMGTPVVAYRSPGLVDSIKDGVSGIIVTENTSDELTKNVKKILEESKLYEKLQRGAIAWSKNFRWEKSVKLSLELAGGIYEK